MKMLESVTVKMLQTPTVLNSPEERIVTDRGMESRIERDWNGLPVKCVLSDPQCVPRYHKVPGTMATPSGALGGVIRLGVDQEYVHSDRDTILITPSPRRRGGVGFIPTRPS